MEWMLINNNVEEWKAGRRIKICIKGEYKFHVYVFAKVVVGEKHYCRVMRFIEKESILESQIVVSFINFLRGCSVNEKKKITQHLRSV